MAVKDGLPSTDFSRMNREYIKAVAEGGSSDPYPNYDVVIATDKYASEAAADYEVLKLDYNSLLAKVRAGELVTGILYVHYNYDEDVEGGTNVDSFPLFNVMMNSSSNQLDFNRIYSLGNLNITSRRFRLTFSDEGTILSAAVEKWNKTLT